MGRDGKLNNNQTVRLPHRLKGGHCGPKYRKANSHWKSSRNRISAF